MSSILLIEVEMDISFRMISTNVQLMKVKEARKKHGVATSTQNEQTFKLHRLKPSSGYRHSYWNIENNLNLIWFCDPHEKPVFFGLF